ncbi:MAG: ACGX-repeat peptide, partial [Clostridia bacterium]|nr:ACGX-repeat peptide [Clostridia bacterium]
MALSNIASWNNGTVSSACGAGSACGAAEKPAEEKKAACGAACGAADKPAETPAA